MLNMSKDCFWSENSRRMFNIPPIQPSFRKKLARNWMRHATFIISNEEDDSYYGWLYFRPKRSNRLLERSLCKELFFTLNSHKLNVVVQPSHSTNSISCETIITFTDVVEYPDKNYKTVIEIEINQIYVKQLKVLIHIFLLDFADNSSS